MKIRLFVIALVSLSAFAAFAQTPEAPAAPAPNELAPPQAAPARAIEAKLAADGDLSPEVLARLSNEQLVQLLKTRENNKVAMQEPPVVAIVVPVAMFIATILIVALILHFRTGQHRRLHETMQKMIEKGVEIPTTLILPPREKNADLRRGLILITSGVGLSVAIFFMDHNADKGAFAIGLIPTFIGIGYLIAWRLEGRQKEAT